MALTSVDRTLLSRCLKHDVGAWNDFVDRFLGLIYHVVRYTAHLRSTPLNAEEVEDLAQEILLQIISDDYKILRQFRGKSSLATYLTVIARRICVHELMRRQATRKPLPPEMRKSNPEMEISAAERVGLDKLEEVQKLMRKLPTKERQIVRLFYLEGRTYEEISTVLDVPVNSIGPVLTRARKRLRHYSDQQAEKKRQAALARQQNGE
ncbi:sigma-70 family RNA polymerase sigma factor [Telmatocola sphagniphila]|jgi:RNA polymerase sigma-70 factor (ECF subfamily)|uniref:Sigma-70 family RNA polymerase sigma factor n=1 Tax=Telmatocola sphagniphila TaxID=1123043 RepID=A0A8E6B520_9BACT|nr:sigma-70 family RNA polymerase sigma factor [Telmatocola sphagniphila]QVL31236.1 sigma-70 family RNA polymerase sigma factor [Telmatocola sphagniphila]